MLAAEAPGPGRAAVLRQDHPAGEDGLEQSGEVSGAQYVLPSPSTGWMGWGVHAGLWSSVLLGLLFPALCHTAVAIKA